MLDAHDSMSSYVINERLFMFDGDRTYFNYLAIHSENLTLFIILSIALIALMSWVGLGFGGCWVVAKFAGTAFTGTI